MPHPRTTRSPWFPVPNHKVNETAKALLGKPKIHVGPLYLGATGEPDGILLIEKTQ